MIRAPCSKGTVVIEWRQSAGPVPYDEAVAWMEARVAAIAAGETPECLWFLEHPPLYTAGTSAREEDLLEPGRLPVYRTGRGGQFTYHGPGQRVVYVMLDLRRRRRDVRAFVTALEEWVIAALALLGVAACRHHERVGVWVPRADGARLADGTPAEDKIAAVGIRLRRWVSFHGLAINVDPDLSHYRGIVPCGITGHGVTSLAALGKEVAMAELDAALRARFAGTLGAFGRAS